MSPSVYLAVAALLFTRLVYLEARLYRRHRRYVYGENAPIPTKTFGQRARTARPDGTTTAADLRRHWHEAFAIREDDGPLARRLLADLGSAFPLDSAELLDASSRRAGGDAQ